ncbi:MAG: AmmeMemoRadiSam system protein B [Bacteroidales bacterium]|nr:AmmeMemoRadiSam system protein B [Bacteroidales bacterium]
MKIEIFVLILSFVTMNISGQKSQLDRQPVVAGSFYPGSETGLKEEIEKLFKETQVKPSDTNVWALISPHAGYVFSGAVAASAYASIPETARYDNVFIIGSSHHVSFSGASVYTRGDYITPLGRVKVNRSLGEKLIKDGTYFTFYENAHTSEHSIEVQIPFLQHLFGSDLQIVPIVIGTGNKEACEKIADALKPWFNGNNLFVISTDFSHYPNYNDAVRIDRSTADAIISGDPGKFLKSLRKNNSIAVSGLATPMCGWTSGLVLLNLTNKNKEVSYKHIIYSNSGDSRYGDKERVVGYHSIIVEGPVTDSFYLHENEKNELLKIARESIRSLLYDDKKVKIEERELTETLMSNLGAFVTLTINGKLRGCIGRFMPDEPLYKIVGQMAQSAAFSDSRFRPLTKKEFETVKIEISVLSPLKKIDNINKIILNRHGVYIRKDFRSGTFLPQVANGKNWTVEEFLGYIARDKAGIGWLGWKDAEIFIYEAFVFGEE